MPLPLALTALLVAGPPAAAAAPAARSPALAKLDEAAELVETGANTSKNLRRALAAYEEALEAKSIPKRRRAAALTDMARARLRLGDLAKKEAAKLRHYQAGRRLAARAQSVDPENADAYFWEAANMATIGRTRGVMNSLFMVDDLKDKLEKALALDADHHYARETMASIYHAVPGFLGGDDDKAEALYREILRRDPDFTPTKVTYAKFLLDRGEKEQARRLLREVVRARRSSVPNDWRKFNKPDAAATLRRLEGGR